MIATTTISLGTKFLSGLICFLSFSLTDIRSTAVRPDFSGKWILDANKSEFGNTPQQAAVKQFSISQKEDSIYIERVTVNANNEEKKTTEVVSLDGKECIAKTSNGRTRKSSVSWSEDGNVMTTVSSYSVPDEPENVAYTLHQSWALSADQKELTVNLTTPDYVLKAVYNKQ